MRKAVLYIAMSLDGYIADADGGVAWPEGQGSGEPADTYSEFVQGIDTILMGWNTYRQIVTELSPDRWVYEGLTTYVITHSEEQSTEQIRFTDRNPAELLAELKKEEGKDIWICGGASLVGQLTRRNLIDRYRISVIPTLLGGGIRLFEEFPKEQKLVLTDTRTGDGIIELMYERRPSHPQNSPSAACCEEFPS